jgi:hypothetical protein
MKNTKTILAVISIVAAFSMAPAAFANHAGLVRVDLRGVAETLAKNIYVKVGNVPATVDVHPFVASEACQLPLEALPLEKNAEASCVAKIASPALNEIVDWQISHYPHP